MSKQYDSYLKGHIANIKKAFGLLTPYLIKYDVMTADECEKMKGNLEKHDISKFGRDEYDAYDKYFFGSKQEKDLYKNDFKIAKLHHFHTSPHHWQYYIIPCENDDGTNEVLEMPLKFIIEMVCDWWTFGLAKNSPSDILDWYEENKDKIVFHKETRKLVNQIMYLVYCYLNENRLLK